MPPLTLEIETRTDPASWSTIPCDSGALGSQWIPALHLVLVGGGDPDEGRRPVTTSRGVVYHVSRSHTFLARAVTVKAERCDGDTKLDHLGATHSTGWTEYVCPAFQP